LFIAALVSGKPEALRVGVKRASVSVHLAAAKKQRLHPVRCTRRRPAHQFIRLGPAGQNNSPRSFQSAAARSTSAGDVRMGPRPELLSKPFVEDGKIASIDDPKSLAQAGARPRPAARLIGVQSNTRSITSATAMSPAAGTRTSARGRPRRPGGEHAAASRRARPKILTAVASAR